MVGKDKPTLHASHHHVTAITFLLIGIIIITTSISFVFPLVLDQNHPAMAQQQQQSQANQTTLHLYSQIRTNYSLPLAWVRWDGRQI